MIVVTTAAVAAAQVAEVEKRGAQGPSLLLIPDAGVSWRSWSPFLERNAEKYRMVAVTLKDSETGAAKLSALLDQERLRGVIAVGQGSGGAIALALAAKRPDAVSGVMALNGPITSRGDALDPRPLSLDYVAPDRQDLYLSLLHAAPHSPADTVLRAVNVPVLALRSIPRGPSAEAARKREAWNAELKRAAAPLNVHTAFVDGGEYLLEEFLPEVVDDAVERFVRGQEVKDYSKLLPPLQPGESPCSHDPAYRAFDFWIGDWDVKPAQGPVPPKPMFNRITREDAGCVIREAWSGAALTGQSLNIFDASRRLWRQFWADSNGGVHEYWGRWVKGSMRFSGLVRGPRSGVAVPTRLTFFVLGPDKVRQFSEQSRDGGKTWSTAYDLIYERRK